MRPKIIRLYLKPDTNKCIKAAVDFFLFHKHLTLVAYSRKNNLLLLCFWTGKPILPRPHKL